MKKEVLRSGRKEDRMFVRRERCIGRGRTNLQSEGTRAGAPKKKLVLKVGDP